MKEQETMMEAGFELHYYEYYACSFKFMEEADMFSKKVEE